MRVAAISDVHGNLPALEAVLAEIEREGAHSTVVLGDTISGPWPVDCFDLIRGLGAYVVRGNADREVIERSDGLGPLAVWCAERLGEERLAAAAAWPLALELDVDGLGRVLFCHSTPRADDPIYTRLTPETEVIELLRDASGADVVVSGHTHMQYDRRLSSGLRVVNPGSVGMPYEGVPGAYWALLGPDVDFRRSEYDAVATVAAARVLGAPLDPELASQLVDPPTAEETSAYFESIRAS